MWVHHQTGSVGLSAHSQADVTLLDRLAAVLADDAAVRLTTLLDLWERHDRPHTADTELLRAAVVRLRGECLALRAALKPLADAVATLGDRDTLDGGPLTDASPLIDYLRVWCAYRSPTIGDGRRAAELLAAIPDPADGHTRCADGGRVG